MTATNMATYTVSGMTCGHCVSAVEVELVPGGDSRVTVSATAPLAEEAVRSAIQEAGYDLAGVHR